MSVMNRDFAADADRVAAVSSATRLDSLRYRRVTARCMPAAFVLPGAVTLACHSLSAPVIS
jgi:hypothetical protein